MALIRILALSLLFLFSCHANAQHIENSNELIVIAKEDAERSENFVFPIEELGDSCNIIILTDVDTKASNLRLTIYRLDYAEKLYSILYSCWKEKKKMSLSIGKAFYMIQPVQEDEPSEIEELVTEVDHVSIYMTIIFYIKSLEEVEKIKGFLGDKIAYVTVKDLW